MNNCVFNQGNHCSALNEKECRGCSFRKTESELIEGRAKAKERIDNLPPEQKYHIINKYYKYGTKAFEK